MLIIDCYGSLASMKVLSICETKIRNNNNLLPGAKKALLKGIKIIRSMCPFIGHCHKALFYCTWQTYHIAKRLTGIHYVSTKKVKVASIMKK